MKEVLHVRCCVFSNLARTQLYQFTQTLRFDGQINTNEFRRKITFENVRVISMVTVY